jgi:hypothetical protein
MLAPDSARRHGLAVNEPAANRFGCTELRHAGDISHGDPEIALVLERR